MSKDQSPKTKAWNPKTKIPINLVFGLWSSGFGFWSLGFGLRASVFGLWASVFGLWASVFGLWGSVFGLWASVFGQQAWYSLLCSTLWVPIWSQYPFCTRKGAVKPKRFPDAERSSKKPIYYAVLFEACKNIVKLEERAWWRWVLKGRYVKRHIW